MENPDDLAARAYRRLLTETIVERDIGAQETCHMLLELPLVECSRRFVNLNVSLEMFKPVTLNNENENDEENNEEKTKSFIDGYKKRPLCMEGVTLIDAARSWIYNPKRKRDNKWEPREKAAIVRVFPRFVSIPSSESGKWIEFCLSELLLYKPFRDIERDIGHDDASIIQNWETLNYNPWHVQRTMSAENVENPNDSETEENEDVHRNTTEHEWEIISRLHQGQNIHCSEIDMLGRRDVDRQTNWSVDYQGEEYTARAINFISNMKNHGCLIYDEIPQCINYTTLGEKQEKAVNIIMTHYHRNQNAEPLFMIIQGTTGTGKSYLIGAISQSLQNAAMPSPSPLLLLAPTGVAAFNIGASTIHSKLRIPIRDFSQLEGARLTSFQEEMSHVKYILIDEMSFIGQNMLENIDSRLRQAFPQSAHISFGGKDSIFVS
jgi:DNA replication protein DnaC